MNTYLKIFTLLIGLFSCTFSFAQSSRPAYQNAQTILKNMADDTAKVNQLNILSGLYLQTNIDSVLYLALSAKAISEKLKYPIGTADALVNISRYYQNKADYSSAMENCLQALHEYEAMKMTGAVANTYLLLANVSKDMSGQNRTNNYVDNGIIYTKAAYKAFSSVSDTAGLVSSLITSGILFRDKAIQSNQNFFYDTAFTNYTTALKLIESTKKGVQQLPRLYNNISQVYIEYKKDYRKALEYLFKAVAINESDNKQSSLSYNYGNISNAYVQLHNYEKALGYARLMLAVTEKMQRPSRIQNALRQLYQVYNANGKADSALHYYILADRINDSITDINKTSQVMELQTKYETNKKELTIKNLNLEDATKTRRITILFSALILFGVFAAWMILLYRRVNKQRQQISTQSTKLQVMLKELHHRVKNNLQIVGSLLSLQAYNIKDEATILVLKESQQRVEAMSLIHQALYKTENITSVNMKDYVTLLAQTLLSAYGYHPQKFYLEINIEEEIVDVDKALPLGLIINELVTNCMKYAYKGILLPSLKVALTQNNGSIKLVIKDNGIGLDENLWNQKTSSFGKQLITALSKQLRAKQTIIVDNGTQFTITIPAKAA